MSIVGFRLLSSYLKDLSFENPKGPDVLTPEQFNSVDFALSAKLDHDGPYYRKEVALTLTITAKVAQKPLFLCELTCVAVVELPSAEAQFLPGLLKEQVPMSLLPLINQVANGAVKAGGYPGMHLHDLAFLHLQDKPSM